MVPACQCPSQCQQSQAKPRMSRDVLFGARGPVKHWGGHCREQPSLPKGHTTVSGHRAGWSTQGSQGSPFPQSTTHHCTSPNPSEPSWEPCAKPFVLNPPYPGYELNPSLLDQNPTARPRFKGGFAPGCWSLLHTPGCQVSPGPWQAGQSCWQCRG